MTTRFVQVSWGLQYTDAFLHINTIKSYIQSFQNGRKVDDTTKMSESIALLSQDRMAEEIHQHIRISDKLAKEELFEYLIGWIQYFEYNLNNTNRIEELIQEYNEKRLIEYKTIVELEEAKFKETKEYKTLNHLDFYEVDYGWLAMFSAIHAAGHKRLVQYYKFFEAPDPDLIDNTFLPEYIEVINPIISRCVDIARKRLKYLKEENEPKQLLPSQTIQTAITTAQNSDKLIDISISQIKNNFDLVNINEVYQHFKVGLVDKKFFSEEELVKYLYSAFDKKTPPEKLFILSDANKKGKIIKVFNEYFQSIAGKPHGKQKEYAALLGNYFRGYKTENVSTNFSK